MPPVHPQTDITFTTEVEAIPEWASQPEVEITLTTDVDVVPPASSGGQPDVLIEFITNVDYEPPVVTENITGEAHLRLSASGEAQSEIEPVPVPVNLADRFTDLEVVSITMPEPSTFDQFGRPTG